MNKWYGVRKGEKLKKDKCKNPNSDFVVIISVYKSNKV